MLHVKSFIDFQKENENRLWKFLDFVEHVLCNPCWNRRRVQQTDGYKCVKQSHHNGGFLKLLNQKPKISNDDLLKWIHDDEHGLAHGLSVAFFYYQLFDDKDQLHQDLQKNNYECSKILYSCLFHDFVKVIYEIEPHDQLLRDFFNNCLEETYYHSNPSSETLLTLADKLELARFDDYKEWVDLNKLSISKFGHSLFQHFFKHIRPALGKIITGYDDLWMCHSSEISYMNEAVTDHINFYPEFFIKREEQFAVAYTKLFSIASCDHDNWPRECSDIKYGGSFARGIVGCIPKKSYRKYGELCVLQGRDHFYFKAHQQIPIKDWLFLYRTTKQLEEINLREIALLNSELTRRLCVIVDKIISVVMAIKVE